MTCQVVTFADLVQRGSLLVNDGYRTKSEELGRPGIPILRVAEVQDGHLSPSFGDHVRDEFRGKIGVKTSEPRDVVLTTKGTVGRVARIPAVGPVFVYSPQVCFFRVIDRALDPRWLYYWFHGSQFRGQAAGVQSQTDMAAYINLADLRAMTLSLPSVPEQRGIAATLGALDDKIESNRQLSKLAIDLARTLLSQGSRLVRVGDVADVVRGLSYSGAGLTDEENVRAKPMINLANFSTEGWLKPEGLKYYEGDHQARHEVQAGDLIVANTDLTQQRVILGRPALASPVLSGALFTHHTSLIRFSSHPEYRLPLWAQLNSWAFRKRAEGFATGTTVAALPASAILDFEFSVPGNAQLVQVCEELLEKVWAAESESQRMIALRDVLLPELLSGRLRVPEAREAVAEVVDVHD